MSGAVTSVDSIKGERGIGGRDVSIDVGSQVGSRWVRLPARGPVVG